MPGTMQAVVISEFGGPEVLVQKEVAKPVPKAGEVLIEVKAFGVNYAEMHMRKGEWDQWNPVSGLEAVGVVAECPGGEIPIGSTIAAVMGGMGRNRPGGYGQYVAIPVANTSTIKTKLSWEDLAAIPEVYSTAHSCMETILHVKAGDSVLIRGATSTVGQAAIHLAVDVGAKVTATTRREERFAWLKSIGCTGTVKEQKGLDKVLGDQRFDKVFNLVGNSVLLESMELTKTGGSILQAGWLGGLAPISDFNPMLQMKSGVAFSLFHSGVLGSSDWPMSAIPLQEIVTKIENGAWDAKPVKVFEFNQVQDAHRLLDSHDAGGKIVVKH